MLGERGQKYIVECEYTIRKQKPTAVNDEEYVKLKGFEEPVSLDTLIRLKPYDEEPSGVGEDFHYEGLMEAWIACKEILELSPAERNYLFGYEDSKYILRMYEPEEAMEILKNHREQDSFIDELMAEIKLCGKDVSREEVVAFFSSLNDVIEEKPFG